MKFFEDFASETMLPQDRNSEKYLAELQERVNRRRLGLCVKPKLPVPQHFNEAAFRAFLAAFKDKKVADLTENLVRQHLRYISMGELQKNLVICVDQLNSKLEKCTYGVIAAKHHSQQWVAELSLPYLNNLPLKRAWMDDDFKYPRHELKDLDTWVMFDDCAYRGEQLAMQALRNIFAELSMHGDQETTYKVFFVIPFMTQFAKDKVAKQLEEFRIYYEVKIEVEIINNELIKAIPELDLDRETIPDLLPILVASSLENLNGMVLLRTDWKRPDCHSMPYPIADATIPADLAMPSVDKREPFISIPVSPYGMFESLSSCYEEPQFF